MLILRVWTLIYNNITNKYYTSFIFYIPSTDFNHQDMNCYNLSSSIKAKKEPYIELTQKNLIEFLIQSIYLYICYIYHCCCSNHLSLKDKWSHNEQSSLMGYQVKSGRITRELDKEPLLHCSSIYTTTSWSMLQQCVYLMSIHHATISCPITHPHVFSIRPPCFLHVPWRHTFNLRYTCAHHMYTMRNLCSLTSLLTLTPSRLFPILLDR